MKYEFYNKLELSPFQTLSSVENKNTVYVGVVKYAVVFIE